MSNTLASGSAQTPGAQANQNGQQGGDGAANNNNQAPLNADDAAAAAAADAADADAAAAAAANGEGGDGGGDGGDGQGGRSRRDPAERISEVIAERNAAMEFGRYWQEQATRMLQAQSGGNAAGGAAPGAGGAGQPNAGGPPADDPQPTMEQHGFDAAKWAAANNAWMQREIQRQVQTHLGTALSTRDQQQAQQSAQQQFTTRCADFRTKAADFDAVTRNPTLPVTEHMADAIMRSDVGPAVYYHLGKNPTEAARIARQSPDQQRIAIARLEGRLSASAPAPGGGGGGGGNGGAGGGGGGGTQRSAPGTPQRTQAPAPPSRTNAGAQGEINMQNCSLDEYLAARLPHIAGSSRGAPRRS